MIFGRNIAGPRRPAFDPRELTFDRLEFRFGDPKSEDL